MSYDAADVEWSSIDASEPTHLITSEGVIDMSKRYVLGFLFSEDELQIALIRKTRPPWQAGRLNGIGGHVEEGETFNQAMAHSRQEHDWPFHIREAHVKG